MGTDRSATWLNLAEYSLYLMVMQNGVAVFTRDPGAMNTRLRKKPVSQWIWLLYEFPNRRI